MVKNQTKKRKEIVEKKILKKVEQELIKLIKKQEWTNAKTYEKIAPHEYFTFWQNKRFFNKMCKYIQKYGVYKIFQIGNSKQKNKYLYLGPHRYWRTWMILNRTKIRYIIEKNGITRQLKRLKK